MSTRSELLNSVRRGLVAVLLFALNLTASLAGEPLESWIQRTSPTANTLSVVTFGNKLFVAVGLAGTIVTSPDGVAWTRRSSGTSEPLYGVIYGGNQFVAVGGNGVVTTSPDGIRWTLRRSGMGAATYTVAYGKGRYVAVGDVILTSTDGLVWTTQSVPETSALLSPSKVIDGADPLFIFPTPFTVHSLAGVTFLEDRFLAVGAIAVIDFFFGTTYYPKILTSVDGVTWTSRSAPGSNFALSDGIFGNGQFVSVGWGGAILSSANAISWSERARPSAASLNSIAYAEGVFVTVGDFGSIFSSVDGNSWTARTAPITQTIYEVTFGNGSFVAVGDGGTIIQSGSFFVELGYSRTGDQMTFSWDAPAYVLQQNDDVANPATWSLVAGGNVSPVTVTAITATKCFRLVRP